MENQTLEETQEETPVEPAETSAETSAETPAETPVETQPETPEETSEETVETETPKTPEPTVNYEKKFKASQTEAIRLKKENDELRKKSSPEMTTVDEILEVQQATKGLSTEEVVELKRRALIEDIPLSEARKDPNYILWQSAWKAKVEKEKTPPPSTQQGQEEKKKSFLDELRDHPVTQGNWREAIEAKGKILRREGLLKTRRRRPREDIIPLDNTPIR